MADIIAIVTALAAARIQAVGGRPLTEDEMALCVYEAYAIENLQKKIQNGIAVDDRVGKGLAEHGPAVMAHLRQERLGERLPVPLQSPEAAPRF